MSIQFDQIPTGAVVWIDLSIGRHYGRKFADNKVIHLSKKHRKIRFDTVAEFSEGKSVFASITDNLPTQQQMIEGAKGIEGKGYSLGWHNCEHAKEIVAGNPPSSRQVQGTVGGAAAGLALGRLMAFGPMGLVVVAVIGGAIGLGVANSKR